MKGIFIISLILLGVLSSASAYTSEQQTILEGMRLSFQIGAAYQKASQGQNVAQFNALVDEYNKFVGANFGEDSDLLMSKINIAAATSLNPVAIPPYLAGIVQRKPFNDSSDLSKFGKQGVLTPISPRDQNVNEANLADRALNNF
jgi:hypothetical protein